jgi:two-component system response regulator BaeR
MNDERTTIFIVEDEPSLAGLLADYLGQAGHRTRCFGDGNGLADAVRAQKPDLVLLDIMLPGRDGVALCRELRAFSNVPIVFVTARVEELDRLLGLDLGADDYICKPFSPREVVARVRAVLRRSRGPITTLPLELDETRYEALLDGRALQLTAVEFRLLQQLVSEPGRIFSRAQLMSGMYQDHRVVSDRTIDSHIKKLRHKIAQARPDVELIHSVYGVGYKFEPA